VIPARESDFSCDGFEAGNVEDVAKYARGIYDGAALGQDKEQSWSLTLGMVNESFTHASADRITDFVMRLGNHSALGTTDGGGLSNRCGIKIDFSDGAGNTAQIALPNNRIAMAKSIAVDGCTIGLSGRNNGTPTFA
jgi:hypothetical protein